MLRKAFIVLALSLSFPAAGQSPDPKDLDALTAAEAQAKAKAESLAKENAAVETEILQFKEELRKSAAEQASYERASREIDQKLTTLTREETRLMGQLGDDRKAQNELVAALQRVSLTPPTAIMTSAKNATEAARASMIMSSLTEQLSERSRQFADQLTDLTAVRAEMGEERTKLAETEITLNKKRENIRGLVKEKAARAASLSDDVKAEQKRAKELAAKANDLRELIRRFESAANDVIPRLKPAPGSAAPRIKPKPGSRAPEPLNLPEGTRFADARGGLKPPVQGALKSSYGGDRKGITVSTRSSAQVTAPFTGRIEFAGAFKNYDNVVILNVGDNYFMLLTGLGEIFVSSGEIVSAGEPIGLMPNTSANNELYIELRKNGSPINPKPWLGNVYAARG